MALPTIIAVNQTASPILLTRLGLTVPASSSLTLTDFAYRDEIWGDESLYAFVLAGDILLNLGQGALSQGDSLKFWNLIPFQPITLSVRALRDTNVASLSGTITVDGVSLVAGDRVLLTAQGTASQNGIWVVQAGAWVRPDDFGTGQSAAGVVIEIEGEGTNYANEMWVCSTTAGSDTIDTDGLAFIVSAGGGGTDTLQSAYENGNTITTSAGEGTLQFTTGAGAPIAFVLTGDDFTVNGANDVDLGGSTALSTFNLDTTGAITVDSSAAGISLDSVTASNFTVTGASQDLTLSSVGGSVIVQGTEAAADAVRINASNAAGGIDIDSGTGGISVVTTGAADLQASGAVTIDSSGSTIGIGTDADTGAINIGTGAAARAITVGNTTGATSTTLQAGTGNITLQAPLTTVTGDLLIQGTTFQTDVETVLVEDNHLYLNSNYTTAAAQTGGLVVNYLPIATTDTVDTGGFTAGVPATSNPTVITVGSATFAVGQFIQISNANNIGNNGLFEVLSHVGTTLTIRGVGLTGTVEDFTQNQFTTDATVAGAITRVNVTVMRTGTDGDWEAGKGSATPVTFNNVVTTGGTGTLSLQNAYVGGNTINVTSGEGPLAITLTSDDFTVNGANDVDFGGSTAVSTFNVDSSGAVTIDGAGISIDGTSASNLSTTGADLTLSTITSGTLAVTGAAAVNISSGTTTDIQATGNVTLDSSGGSIGIGTDANTGAINIGTAAAARTLTIGNNTGATAVIINSGTEQVQVDGVTYYGNSAGVPTARSGGFQEGDKYYDTTLDMEMRYDATRGKWLSVEAMYIQFGRNGNTAIGAYYMGPDGKVMSSAIGFTAPYAGTIVGLGWTRADTDAATFDVVEGGTSRATVAHSAVSGSSNALNGNFSAGGVIAVLNQAGGNVTTDVMAWVKLKWRA